MKAVFLILAVSLLSCMPEKTGKADIQFNVDVSLLAERHIFSEAEISFRPPSNWELCTADMTDNLRDNLAVFPDNPDFKIELKNIFLHQKKASACFLWIFRSDLLAEDAINSYVTTFKSTNPELKFSEGSFAHNNIDFRQISFVNNDFITTKLIAFGTDQNVFMIDYVIPASIYEEELPSIESSIGTIKKQERGETQ